MNKNIGIIIGIIVLVVVAGGLYSSMSNKDDVMVIDKQTEKKPIIDQKIADEKSMMEKKAMEEKNTMMKASSTKTDMMVKSGSYESYTPEKVMLASANHAVVLFFRAGWCPTCRALDTDIKNNISKIPVNLAILDVNYDNSSALKQKYGVTYQHTFVQVDKDGTLIKKWSGSPTLTSIVTEVK